MERTRSAREWLRGAQHHAHERAQIRGFTPVRVTPLSSFRRPEDARAEVQDLGIEPRLMLRPNDNSGLSWDVLLELPDLSHLVFRFPETQAILMGSRCTVAGATDRRPLARGRLLHGAQQIILSRWPDDDEVLLQFEQNNPQLEHLLLSECLLRP